MTAICKKLQQITSLLMMGGVITFSTSVLADSNFSFIETPYVTGGLGFSNVGMSVATVGAGVKVNDWLRLEVDTRQFGKTSESGAPEQVGPMLSDGNTPPGYFCSPCHNESVVEDVKTSGNALSALFTTDGKRAFAYVRVGLLFRTDEITTHPINVYNTAGASTTVADSTYTNAGPQTISISSTEKIIGIGVSGHGFYAEITQYGSYPGIYINHDFYTSIIGYRMDL